MKMRHMMFAAAAAVLLLGGCRRTDVREFSIDVPTLSRDDLPAVTAALAPYGGIEKSSIRFDPAAHRLTLRYDSMQLAKKNIEMEIAKAGFAANGVTPESVGARPKGK